MHVIKKQEQERKQFIYNFLLTVLICLCPELHLENLSHLLDKVFLIFPNYCLGMSFSQFYQNYEFISFCTSGPLSATICKLYSKYNVAS